MDRRETEATTIWQDDDGIVHVEFKPVPNTAETAVELMEAIAELTDRRPAAVLFDASKFTSSEPAAWMAFTERIMDVALAGAVIVGDDIAGRYEGYRSAINSMMIPFEAFESEDEALAFLRSLL